MPNEKSTPDIDSDLVPGTKDRIKELFEEKYGEIPEIQPDNFDIFHDRALSLLERWKKHHDKYPLLPHISKNCIQGFLNEVDDNYTKQLKRGE